MTKKKMEIKIELLEKYIEILATDIKKLSCENTVLMDDLSKLYGQMENAKIDINKLNENNTKNLGE